jgi:hypothetical protein
LDHAVARLRPTGPSPAWRLPTSWRRAALARSGRPAFSTAQATWLVSEEVNRGAVTTSTRRAARCRQEEEEALAGPLR